MKRQLPNNLALDRSVARQLADVIPDRTAGVIRINGGDVKSQFEGMGILNTMRPQRAAIEDINSGAPMSQFYPYADNNILESFRVKNVRPSMENPLPLTENPTNTVQPHTCYVMPLRDSMDAVSVREIGIRMKGDGPHDMKSTRVVHGYMQSHPQVMVNIATWNYMMYEKQIEMARDYPEDYAKLTPDEIWKDWVFAGICEAEEMADGSESSATSGFGNGFRQAAGGYKVLTMVTNGLVYAENVIGDNILPGGEIYAIIKRQGAVPPEYILQSKPNMASLGGLHRIENPGEFQVENLTKKIRPLQMSIICLPRGGLVPAEATMYRDDDDDVCYDAKVIRLGKIWATPYGHEYKELQNYANIDPVTRRIPDSQKGDAFAFSDTISAIDNSKVMYMRVMYHCNDGISPI